MRGKQEDIRRRFGAFNILSSDDDRETALEIQLSQRFECPLFARGGSQRASDSTHLQFRKDARNSRLGFQVLRLQFVELVFAPAPVLDFFFTQFAKVMLQNFAARMTCVKKSYVNGPRIQSSFAEQSPPSYFVDGMAVSDNSI